MPIDDNGSRVQYTASAGQTVFAYPFEIFEDADLKVYLTPNGQTADDTADILTLTTDYTVSGAGNQNGGNVTLVTAASSGDIVTIVRDVQVKRTTDYQDLGDLLADTLDGDADKVIAILQQIVTKLGRSIQLADSDPASGLVLPVSRANQFLGFDANGNPIAAAGASANLGPVSAYIDTLLDDADAATARATLGVDSLLAAIYNQTLNVGLADNYHRSLTFESLDAYTTILSGGGVVELNGSSIVLRDTNTAGDAEEVQLNGPGIIPSSGTAPVNLVNFTKRIRCKFTLAFQDTGVSSWSWDSNRYFIVGFGDIFANANFLAIRFNDTNSKFEAVSKSRSTGAETAVEMTVAVSGLDAGVYNSWMTVEIDFKPGVSATFTVNGTDYTITTNLPTSGAGPSNYDDVIFYAKMDPKASVASQRMKITNWTIVREP